MQNTYSGLVWYQVTSRCLAAAERCENCQKEEAPKEEALRDEFVQARDADQPAAADPNRENEQPPPANGKKDVDQIPPTEPSLQSNSTTLSSTEGEAEGQKSTH